MIGSYGRLALILLCFLLPRAAVQASIITQDDFDKRVAGLMEYAGIPGLSLALIKDGEVLKLGYYGVDNTETQEPVTGETLFQAASLSKPVTAYITLKLVDQGLLGLDTPLHTILPSERFANQDYAKLLTARLVLSHQPGLPNWGGTPLEFQREPGTRFSYSGEGYVYLRQVLSHLTGLTLEELARREVFTPLNMANSYFLVPGDGSVKIANPHNNAGKALPIGEPYSNAASSLHTEASDFAKFMRAIVKGEGLSEASHHAMLMAQVKTPVKRIGGTDDAPLSDNMGWALGWGTLKRPDHNIVWHWGDNGTYRAFVSIDPEKGDGVVYFANTSLGHTITKGLYELLGQDMSQIMDWLEYKAYDDPGFQSWRKGQIAESDGDYILAKNYYEQSIAETGGTDKGLSQLLGWYDTYLPALTSKISVMNSGEVHKYVGQYGPRKVWHSDGYLRYQRGSGREYRLIPAGDHRFLLEGLTGFSFQFEFGEDDVAQAIAGSYSNGNSDRNERGEE